ncbi:hypothetical protein C8F04DRAFT_970409, partial [Mycena alexandri]
SNHASAPARVSKKKKKAHRWAIPKKDVPEEGKGVQKAIHTHCRILMQLLTSRDVPERLTEEMKAPFKKWFKSADDVQAQLNTLLANVIPATEAVYQKVADFLNSVEAMDAQIAIDTAKLRDHHLRSMSTAVANAGLPWFKPDVFGDAESLYNPAHEHVFVHSFRVVGTLFGYSGMYDIKMALVRNDAFVQRFYRSFVYGYMKDQAGIEGRQPGQLSVNIMKNNITRPREDCLASEKDCHSDDEGGNVAREKPGRDAAVHSFFDVLTRRRDDRMADLSRVLPTQVPINYFSPDFFNNMTVRERASYAKNGIALPTKDHCRTWGAIQKWKGLNKAVFMAQYGNAKLLLYSLPTPEELEQLRVDDLMDTD